MIADKTLVAGAAQIGKSKQPAKIAESFAAGIEKGFGLFEKYQDERKKIDAEISATLNTIGDDYDPSLFEVPEVNTTLTNALINSKRKAANLLQERQGLSPTDDRYLQITSEINSIKGSFDRLNQNAINYNSIAKQYAEVRKTKQLSTALPPEVAKDLDAILLDKKFDVREDSKGNLTYIANGREYRQDQLDDFAIPNYNLATAHATQIETVEKYSQSTGKEIKEGDTQYNKLAIGLGNLLNNYTDQELKSAGIDGFINGQPLFLSTPEEKSTLLALSGAELKAFVQEKLMDNYLNISSEAAKLYKAPEVKTDKPTEGDKKYARDTDNIIAAASQMYSTGIIPDSLPGIGSSTLNTKQDVINAELEAQQAAIADGTLDEDDALTIEQISNKYTAPYYTSDLRPVQNIRQALAQLYEADENQIVSALAKLSNTEGYDPSKLLFSTTPSPTLTADGNKLPPVPAKNEVTQATQLRGEYAYGKNYLDSIEKLINQINEGSILPEGRIGFPRINKARKTKVKERNQKIQQIEELMQALKRDFPNLDLSNIKIPTTQQIS